jgi:hypothetical protein
MAFTDFSYAAAIKAFDLVAVRLAFFDAVVPQQPSAWLLETLQRGKPLAFMSEKSRSEFMIAPVLLEVQSFAADKLTVFSGQRLDVDSERGLNGECDFVISRSEPLPSIQTPILCVVEAKRQDIELWYGQVIAQMVASQEFNRREGESVPQTYGCIATGEAWQFLRLSGNSLEIDANRYYLVDLPDVLGVFKAVLQKFL